MCAEVGRSGRALGPKGQGTRQRLLEVLRGQLEKGGTRSLRVTRIAREAGTSPATFYQYFDDVEMALRELALSTPEPEGALAVLAEPWTREQAPELARRLASAYLDHWDQHGSVLAVRNAAAESGDRALAEARERSLSGQVAALEARLGEGRESDPRADSRALAAVIGSMLERTAASAGSLAERGVSRGALVDACAHVLLRVLGRPDAP